MNFVLNALVFFSVLVLAEQVPVDYNGERCSPSKKCKEGYCCRRLIPTDPEGFCLPGKKENQKCHTSFLMNFRSCGCLENLYCGLDKKTNKHKCIKYEDEGVEGTRKRALSKK